MTRATWIVAGAAALFFCPACADLAVSQTGGGSGGGGSSGGGSGGGGSGGATGSSTSGTTGTGTASGTGGGPASCQVDADCTAPGACPADAAMGCACATTPSGLRCVPRCSTAADCSGAAQACTGGVCVGGGGGAGGGGGGPEMNTANTISDQAQSATIAFDGLAFVTGSFCAQTFYPPGKVADFFGFQYLRDNDPTQLGHNTEFTTLTADPVLALMTDAQIQTFVSLSQNEKALAEAYGWARFPLAKAFRRLLDGQTPAGHPALDLAAVKAYSSYLFGIDGQMSYLRAQAYASVLGSMSAAQKATLDGMKGTGAGTWAQPEKATIDAVMQAHPQQSVDLRTYAGEMLAWYVGSEAADVYFCPERQGTYFGSFFMKDIKAMHIPAYTIDSNMTADMGDAFLAALTPAQRSTVTSLVTQQKSDLQGIVDRRTEISAALREYFSAGAIDQATVLSLARAYGALDGEISAYYATAFAAVAQGLDAAQKSTLLALRKQATASDTADYDAECTGGYLYSAPIPAPQVPDTDFLFGVCSAAGASCATDWACCSFTCAGGACK